MSLKVRCASEIFNLLDSQDFYITKPPGKGDFGTVIKNSKVFGLGSDFEIFSGKILT